MGSFMQSINCKARYHKLSTFTPFPSPFSVLAIALYIYYISVSIGTEARTELK